MVIDRLTIAVASMERMLDFYTSLLGIQFTAVELHGHTLHRATYQGLEILLCPRELAGVDASVNTIQARFVVRDVTIAYGHGVSHGTSLTAPAMIDGEMVAALRDPDGNSLELRQETTP